jgi:hypothetical protein
VIGCLLSIALNVSYTVELLKPLWLDAASRAFDFGSLFGWHGWYIVWNTICFSLDAGVLLYLLSYEYKLFGPGKLAKASQQDGE